MYHHHLILMLLFIGDAMDTSRKRFLEDLEDGSGFVEVGMESINVVVTRVSCHSLKHPTLF